MKDEKETSDIEALLFRPSKVSWGVQATIIKLEPRIERMTLFTIIFIIFLAIIWAYFSIKAVVVDASGEITPVAAPIPVMAKSSFTIKNILVKDNQTLLKDDLVIETTRHLDVRVRKDIELVFIDMAKLLSTEKQGLCRYDCMQKLKIIAEERLNFLDKIDQSMDFYREVVDLNRAFKEYYLQLRAVKVLPETLISLQNEIRINQKRISEIDKRRARQILALEYEELQNKVISLQTSVKEKELNSKSSIDSSRTNYDIALSKINQSFKYYNDNSVVRTSNTGKIRFSNLKGVGQTVSGGETLFLMTQSSSDLWLKFQISEADLSKVKVSQKVKIDLSSYPASEFGIQKATVVEILDKLPVENEQNKTPSFVGFAKLDSQYVRFKGKDFSLRSGMQGNVKIIITHETLLNIFIKKIFSIKEEYLGDM